MPHALRTFIAASFLLRTGCVTLSGCGLRGQGAAFECARRRVHRPRLLPRLQYFYRHQQHARGVVGAVAQVGQAAGEKQLVKQLRGGEAAGLQAFEVDALSYRNVPAPAAVEAEVE